MQSLIPLRLVLLSYLLSPPSSPLCALMLFYFIFLTAGGPGSDLPLYGEAAPDHGADGVLSGGHQGE